MFLSYNSELLVNYKFKGIIIMETIKEKAVTAISSLPDTADIDDIMYRLYSITG